MRMLISGGAKNGKSMYAQRVAKTLAREKNSPLYYVATMEPVDREDRERIERHVRERSGWGFVTIEEPLKLSRIFLEQNSTTPENAYHLLAEKASHQSRCNGIDNYSPRRNGIDNCSDSGVFLVDSLTALLGNNMFRPDGKMNLDVLEDVKEDLLTFSNYAEDIVMVSDFINCDGFDFDNITEKYRENLALLERFLAERYDKVVEVSAGQVIEFKGENK